MTQVSVVIPTHNRPALLKGLLISLQQSSPPPDEVIVVNDSCDPLSIAYIEGLFVRIIDVGENRGLAYARTKGAHAARFPFVLFIDDDNVVAPDMLARLTEKLDQDPSLMAVGPVILYKQSLRPWYTNGWINLTTMRARHGTQVSSNIAGGCIPTGVLHDCFMVRGLLGIEVGWFDQFLFMSGTEFDLFERIRKKHETLRLVTVSQAVCFHDIPERTKSFMRNLGFSRPVRAFYFQRNRAVLTVRHGRWYQKLIAMLVFYPLFSVLYAILFFIIGRFDLLRSHMQGSYAGYRYWIAGYTQGLK